jgi:hypothetical protein
MTWRSRSQPIQVGDRVAYSAAFLRSIGAIAGDMPFARGTVTGLETIGADTVLAVIDWRDEEMPERVNVKNLSRVVPEKGILDL